MKRVKYVKKKGNINRNNKGRITVRGKQNILGLNFNYLSDDYSYVGLRLIKKFLLFFNSIKAKIILKKFNKRKNRFIYLIMFTEGPFCGLYNYCSVSRSVSVNNFIHISCFSDSSLHLGDIYMLSNTPEGSKIYNIGGVISNGAVYARNSVKNACLLNTGQLYASIRMPSGQIKLIYKRVFCTYGELDYNPSKKINKAGDSRRAGYRPKVRGVAMNACDHPHGGGEGKSSIGRCSVFSV